MKIEVLNRVVSPILAHGYRVEFRALSTAALGATTTMTGVVVRATAKTVLVFLDQHEAVETFALHDDGFFRASWADPDSTEVGVLCFHGALDFAAKS